MKFDRVIHILKLEIERLKTELFRKKSIFESRLPTEKVCQQKEKMIKDLAQVGQLHDHLQNLMTLLAM